MPAGTKNFALTNLTKGKLPSLPFARLKTAVLGQDYNLSLVFLGEAKARELNSKRRGKDYATDILSFPLDRKNGEIFICQKIAAIKAKDWDRSPENFLTLLFIHGLLHLKGMAHGSRMEAQEIKFRNRFGI